MSRRPSSEGYAMLVALLIMVLATTFALVVVGAVGSLHAVERSDAAGWRAEVVAGRAFAAASRAIRWQPGAGGGALEGQDPSARQSWRASWAPAPRVAGDVWPRLHVSVSAAAGGARRDVELTMALRAESWASGMTCRGDAEIEAPLEVAGSGVYVGGCLRGRENVGFLGGPGLVTPIGDPADVVRGDDFPVAAVHGGAGIFAGGVEIHEPGQGTLYPFDTDDHVGEQVPDEWLAPPSAEFLAAATAIAAAPADVLAGARLLLDDIRVPVGADAAGGSCLLLPAMDEVTIVGSTPPAGGRLMVIVRGDAVVGEPGETVALSGGLVVYGRLQVRGSLLLDGSLHVGSMVIGAPTSIRVAPGWRERPLAGAAIPCVDEHGS